MLRRSSLSPRARCPTESSSTVDRWSTRFRIPQIFSAVPALQTSLLANPDWAAHTDRMSHGIVNPAVYETLADYMQGRPEEEFPTP